MKNYIYFLLIVSSLSACSNGNKDKIQVDIANAQAPTVGAGKIPADDPVTLMAMNYTNYSWKDVDAYYRGDMMKETNKPHFNNIKNNAFCMLVSKFNLPEQAPKEVIAYYVEEQSAMKYTPCSTEFMACLEKLRGYWPEDKIQNTAKNRYEKTKEYYLTGNWKDYWEQEKSQFEVLLSMNQ